MVCACGGHRICCFVFVTGSLVGQMKYAQFTGTVQVMKAVANHMVLTFCENLPGSQLFSIILSRKPDMLSMDVSVFSLEL